MEALLYFGKVILTSGVMFLYYQLFLKDRTFHHYNRFFLLAILLLSVLLPLIRISYFTIEVDGGIYLLLNSLSAANSNTSLSHDLFNSELLIYGAGLVSVFFLLKFAVAIVRIVQLRKQYPKQTFEGISFYQTDIAEAPFSFFRNLFWKDSILIQSDLGRQILKHEIVHIEQQHSLDRVLAETVTALFWFNPFFHFIKREISLIHEYLADHKTIQNADTQAFAQMLLASRFSGKPLAATSPFLSSNLKKRLKMLKKPKTKFSYARRIAALPVVFVLCFFYLVNAKNREIETANIQIKEYVSAMKRDTVPPPPPPAAVANVPSVPRVEVPKEIIPADAPELAKEFEISSVQSQKLSSDMKSKLNDLQKFSDLKLEESEEFKELSKQLSDMNLELKTLFDDADFKIDQEKLTAQLKNFDEKAYKIDFYKLDEFRKKVPDFEKHAAEMERKVNLPEFKRKIREAEKRAKEAERRINSPEFQQRIKDAEKRAKEMQTKFDTPEFRERLKNAEQKAEEYARRSTEANLLRSGFDGEIKYFLDGKAISKEEMQKLEPKNIASMHVYKKDGKGEIYITSKK